MIDDPTVRRRFGDIKPGRRKSASRNIARGYTVEDRPPLAPDEAELMAVRRGRNELLRLTFAIYAGNPYVSARVFSRNDAGRWYPTAKGVSLRISELPTVVAALQQAVELAREPSRGQSDQEGTA